MIFQSHCHLSQWRSAITMLFPPQKPVTERFAGVTLPDRLPGAAPFCSGEKEVRSGQCLFVGSAGSAPPRLHPESLRRWSGAAGVPRISRAPKRLGRLRVPAARGMPGSPGCHGVLPGVQEEPLEGNTAGQGETLVEPKRCHGKTYRDLQPSLKRAVGAHSGRCD